MPRSLLGGGRKLALAVRSMKKLIADYAVENELPSTPVGTEK
jgi:hypothetical protein